MRRLGLIGGMSWQSTQIYYQLLNEGVASALGSPRSADLLLHSVDFGPLVRLQERADWPGVGRLLAESALALERAGAEMLLLCTNTMHLAADAIREAIQIPFLDLIDVVATTAQAEGHRSLGLLGTAYTMQAPLYPERMARYGIDVRPPPPEGQRRIHEIIYSELCQGRVTPDAQRAFQELVTAFQESGTDAVILGCTELRMLLDGLAIQRGPALLDSTEIHVQAALRACLS